MRRAYGRIAGPTSVTLAILLAAVGTVLNPVSDVKALWSDTVSTSSISGSFGTLAAPTNIQCTDNSSVLAGSVILKWNPVANATAYRVLMRTSAGPNDAPNQVGTTQPQTEMVISAGLLSGLLQSLLSTLLGGHLIFTVEAQVGGNWVSAESTRYRVNPGITLTPLSLNSLTCVGPL